MRALKIAYSPSIRQYFSTTRNLIHVQDTDFTDIAAAIVSDQDREIIEAIYETRFEVPVFVYSKEQEYIDEELREKIYRWVYIKELNQDIVDNEIESAAEQYEWRMLPPFFETLSNYIDLKNQQFNCPGHQGGQYFRKHPAGRYLYDFYGETIFRSDICNADVALGDLLIHEGPAEDALKNAAKVFNSDNTFFVMNGTSTSNIIVASALVAPGDLVLFDRNNHKSNYDAALVQAGGRPIYLETSRNPFGFIGGIDDHCFEEDYLRERIAKVDPQKAQEQRPFRLAIIQLGTYDGTVYNARQVVDRIGHLCDYILFDSAWVGYEQFIPMMRDCSPLLLELGPDDPGIFVTQSVHKQQAGFSQSSYIHKKDSHIKGQKRYLGYKRFNNSYRSHSSTSPFYPIFAALDVNARMQDRASGRKMWADCVKMGIEARKSILRNCGMLKPFIPPTIRGKRWEEYETEEISESIEFFKFIPGEKWHSFEGYGKEQYFLDPNKLLLTTPGIDAETGEYEDFGIPATILASFLRDNRIIPEKNDFNSILFLMTPAESKSKLDSLVAQLMRFEQLIRQNAPVSQVMPYLYWDNEERYRGVGIADLCQEMHDFYKERNAKEFQRELFREETFPEVAMLPYEAGVALIRNQAKMVSIDEIQGEVALEGALPYPPGIFCVAPGERWSRPAVEYFKILEEGINRFPGFAPEIHGVYLKKKDGKTKAFAYVLQEEE